MTVSGLGWLYLPIWLPVKHSGNIGQADRFRLCLPQADSHKILHRSREDKISLSLTLLRAWIECLFQELRALSKQPANSRRQERHNLSKRRSKQTDGVAQVPVDGGSISSQRQWPPVSANIDWTPIMYKVRLLDTHTHTHTHTHKCVGKRSRRTKLMTLVRLVKGRESKTLGFLQTEYINFLTESWKMNFKSHRAVCVGTWIHIQTDVCTHTYIHPIFVYA